MERAEVVALAEEIRDELGIGKNTHQRIGNFGLSLIEWVDSKNLGGIEESALEEITEPGVYTYSIGGRPPIPSSSSYVMFVTHFAKQPNQYIRQVRLNMYSEDSVFSQRKGIFIRQSGIWTFDDWTDILSGTETTTPVIPSGTLIIKDAFAPGVTATKIPEGYSLIGFELHGEWGAVDGSSGEIALVSRQVNGDVVLPAIIRTKTKTLILNTKTVCAVNSDEFSVTTSILSSVIDVLDNSSTTSEITGFKAIIRARLIKK